MAFVVGTVAAGFPSPAEQYEESPLDLNKLLVKQPLATYFVRVQGDSMLDIGIFPDDLLVVDRSLEPSDGDIIVASVNGEYTVKQFIKNKDGSIILRPANKKFKDIKLKAWNELKVFGVVTSAIHAFKGTLKSKNLD